MPVKTLIDNAAKMVGSRRQLALAMGVSSSRIYDWESERTVCVPEDRVRLAAIAGENPVQALLVGVIETKAGKPNGEDLKIILKPHIWDDVGH